MIRNEIWYNPDFAEPIQEFRRVVRMYWKMGVKKYFSKRETNYRRSDGTTLDPKINHRFVFAPFGEGGEPRIQNALVVNWIPYTGHVRVNVAPIMVKSTGASDIIGGGKKFKPRRYLKPTQTMLRTYRSRSGQSAYDLIRILSEGTRETKGRYIARIDARTTTGSRRGTDTTAWTTWFDEFMSQVDFAIERLADKIEERTANYLIGIEEF